MRKITVILLLGGILITNRGWAESEYCVPTVFNVTYSCNGGSVSGTLPANTTVEYGKSFSPKKISESKCTPPAGKIYAGQAIIVDGIEVAHRNDSFSTSSFTFLYASDVEIGPHWASVAEPNMLVTNMGTGGRTYAYTSGASGTWTAEMLYGAFGGASKCSDVFPKRGTNAVAAGVYAGLIALDQNAIEEDGDGGQFCYCKMTQPVVSGSPWVFLYYYDTYTGCASNCAESCGNASAFVYYNDRRGRFLASLFIAVE